MNLVLRHLSLNCVISRRIAPNLTRAGRDLGAARRMTTHCLRRALTGWHVRPSVERARHCGRAQAARVRKDWTRSGGVALRFDRRRRPQPPAVRRARSATFRQHADKREVCTDGIKSANKIWPAFDKAANFAFIHSFNRQTMRCCDSAGNYRTTAAATSRSNPPDLLAILTRPADILWKSKNSDLRQNVPRGEGVSGIPGRFLARRAHTSIGRRSPASGHVPFSLFIFCFH